MTTPRTDLMRAMITTIILCAFTAFTSPMMAQEEGAPSQVNEEGAEATEMTEEVTSDDPMPEELPEASSDDVQELSLIHI